MPLDDKKVLKYIIDAFRMAGALDRTIFDQVLGARNLVIAWRDRDAATCSDLELAAADHYLEARLVGGINGNAMYPVIHMTIDYYDILKALGVVLRTGKCPTSSPNGKARLWAHAGLLHGMQDFPSREYRMRNPFQLFGLTEGKIRKRAPLPEDPQVLLTVASVHKRLRSPYGMFFGPTGSGIESLLELLLGSD
jgi:hypothetical protein